MLEPSSTISWPVTRTRMAATDADAGWASRVTTLWTTRVKGRACTLGLCALRYVTSATRGDLHWQDLHLANKVNARDGDPSSVIPLRLAPPGSSTPIPSLIGTYLELLHDRGGTLDLRGLPGEHRGIALRGVS